MKNHPIEIVRNKLISIVGRKNLYTDPAKTRFYRKGIRVGKGEAFGVVFPKTLLQLWEVLNVCIAFDKVIIMQAANTGLTGGSTPFGSDYDRDIVIINTLNLDQLVLLNNGTQVIGFPGTTLYQLEKKLSPLGRGPHSVIGSSCIGASVVGGVCNNSGGNLVNRGPAYTELSLYARLNNAGELKLCNHLEIDLGDSPEEILTNLQKANFQQNNLPQSNKMASDNDYKKRVRDFSSDSPARFNSDKRRLYEASGCAGKIAVFAVRLDTFPNPDKQKVFYVGTNKPHQLTLLREKILAESKYLPDMGEYIHRSYFDGADKYCKDNFLFIKYLGTEFLPKILFLKRNIDQFFSGIFFLPDDITDRLLQYFANLLPDHLPRRLREYRESFEHHMLFQASDKGIKSLEEILEYFANKYTEFNYIECDPIEGSDALLHRYVAGAAPARYKIINSQEAGDILPLDIALPRNCHSWHEIITPDILSKVDVSFQMGHFLCMVFHWDFVVKKDVDLAKLKQEILTKLDIIKAKYPAEHNVGHLYKADKTLEKFYRDLDPTNTFNSGIGQTSKNKNYL